MSADPRPMTRQRRHIVIATCAAAALFGSWLGVRFDGATHAWPARLSDQEFWGLVVSFSEPDRSFRVSNGYRSDNLISNERSLQQVMPGLQETVRAGGYLGVGSEQNFTYITALKPTIAFIIDIRRQNMLLHLMYKAVVEISTDRVDFLSHQFSRPHPAGVGHDSTPQAIFEAFKAVSPSEELAQANLRAIFNRLERVHGFPLTPEDEGTIKDTFHSFYNAGPDIRWDPDGGAWIPSYADLMAQTDPRGQPRSYLASEENFQALKRYETNNRIVPLVGDFGGDKAMRAVGRYLKDHADTVAAFYTSNVEGYLHGEGRRQFIRNVSMLPLHERSTFIRTIFTTIAYCSDTMVARRDFNCTRPGPEYQTSTVIDPIRGWLNTWQRE